jgi:chromosomal replication initiation ATPase DnaA
MEEPGRSITKSIFEDRISKWLLNVEEKDIDYVVGRLPDLGDLFEFLSKVEIEMKTETSESISDVMRRIVKEDYDLEPDADEAEIEREYFCGLIEEVAEYLKVEPEEIWALGNGSGSGEEITAEKIIDAVADHYNVSVKDIISRKRSNKLANARMAVMYFCREHTSMGISEIGKFLGKRDHATVIYSCQKVCEMMKSDDLYRQEIEDMNRVLKLVR